MKKLILTLSIIFAGLFAVNAQANADKQTDKLMDTYTSVCQLTPDQVTKVRPMVQNFVQTRLANKQQYAGNMEAMKNANKENRQNLFAQLKTVLTPAQQQELKDYMQKEKERRQQRGGAHSAPNQQ